MATDRLMRRVKRRAVAAATVTAALAIGAPLAAPVDAASAATPSEARLAPLDGFGGFGGFPGFDAAPLSFIGPQVAIGPTVIGSVFNGGTTVVVSTEPAQGNTVASP
jgi:hypothetical protein